MWARYSIMYKNRVFHFTVLLREDKDLNLCLMIKMAQRKGRSMSRSKRKPRTGAEMAEDEVGMAILGCMEMN